MNEKTIDERWNKPAYDEMVAALFDGKAWASPLKENEAKLLVLAFAKYVLNEVSRA